MVLSIILAICLFLIPSNWFLQLSQESAYLAGLRVDYLIPKLYPITIILLCTLLFFCAAKKQLKIDSKILERIRQSAPKILIVSALIISQLWIGQDLLTLNWLIIIATIYFFVRLLLKNLSSLKSKKSKRIIFAAIVATLVFQSLVGILQFLTQKELLGYWFLGETNLSRFANISKITIGGREIIAAYGTTPHPNILAGYLAILTPLLWLAAKQIGKNKNATNYKLVAAGTSIISLIAIILTFSVSGLLTLASSSLVLMVGQSRVTKIYQRICLIMLLLSALAQPIAGLLLEKTNFKSPSISRRLELAQASIWMWLSKPITGVGLGKFTANLENFTQVRELARFIQPVHHVGLLWLSEVGLIGLALFWKAKKYLSLSIAAALPALILDHYWLTQPNALLLFAILPVLAEIFASNLHLDHEVGKRAEKE